MTEPTILEAVAAWAAGLGVDPETAGTWAIVLGFLAFTLRVAWSAVIRRLVYRRLR